MQQIVYFIFIPQVYIFSILILFEHIYGEENGIIQIFPIGQLQKCIVVKCKY